jgi:hypothetical protein
MTLVEQGDGFDLAHYRADAVELDTVAFEAQHGKAFLLLGHDSEAGLQFALGPRKTVSSMLRPDAGAWRPEDFRVWPVRKTARSLIARNIWVGRTKTNDVVIPDVSLSKFHAFFRRDEEGRWTLTDAGSRNGTFVDERRAKKLNEGNATALAYGARVRFGSVDLTFVDAAALRRIVLEVFE